MAWLKKNFLFTLVMVLLAAAFIVQMFFVLGARAEANDTEKEFDRLAEEYRQLVEKDILPHEDNVTQTREEITRRREELELFHDALQGRADLEEIFANPPSSRAAAFFEIESFVEEYRRKALRAEIEYSDDERFGFQAYASQGPGEDRIPEVHRQRVIAAYILDTLFETRPEAFHAIERPGDGGGDDGRRQQGGGAARVQPELSLETEGVVETLPFQVTFTGYTSTLRDFANRIATYDLPLVIRQVQVEGGSGEGGASRRAPQRDAGSERDRRANGQQAGAEGEESDEPEDEEVPLVEATPARFTVAMEFLDVKPLQDDSSR